MQAIATVLTVHMPAKERGKKAHTTFIQLYELTSYDNQTISFKVYRMQIFKSIVSYVSSTFLIKGMTDFSLFLYTVFVFIIHFSLRIQHH